MTESLLIIENYPGRGDCIARLMRQFGVPFTLLKPYEGAIHLPPRTAGVVLSGGPQSITEVKSGEGPWFRPTLGLIEQAVRNKLPVLGVCLGHQLLAAWGGGQVAKLPNRVTGFQEVTLHQQDDPLLCSLGASRVHVFQYHEDHVTRLPGDCHVLASSDTCTVEAFRFADHSVWGVQFHPEVIKSDADAILQQMSPQLSDWNPSTDVSGPYVLQAFARMCGL